MMADNKYFLLLKSWCDRIIENQITQTKDPFFYGGALCPACSMIHGRIGDAVYPLTAMYRYTGDARYLDAAKRVVTWSERNVRRSHGGYFNDKLNFWIGISVFSSISYGETLLRHADVLDEETRREWSSIHRRITDYVREKFTEPGFHNNANYFASYCSAMAIAYKLTGEDRYASSAVNMANYFRDNHITDDYMIKGEGNFFSPSPKGLYGIDVGYNVEESIPALTAYAYYMQDEDYMELCIKLWERHLELMIPDGAWDNSTGSRHNKWTYYGSRTSDGAAVGLSYIWKRSPLFAEAMERNFELMRACSRDGYLYGGGMYIEAGEDPCLHHSFTHAKSLAAMLDCGFAYTDPAELPREREYGLKHINSMGIDLISIGDYRATVSGYDAYHHVGSCTTGGSITLLWNKRVGPIFASTMYEYLRAEPYNMQLSRNMESIPCLTMRIDNGKYSSVNCTDVTLESSMCDGSVRVSASGVLRDSAFCGDGDYRLDYSFDGDAVYISAISSSGGELILPVICGSDGRIQITGSSAIVSRSCGTIRVDTDGEIVCKSDEVHAFNPVGGFVASVLRMRLERDKPLNVTLRVE